MLLFTLVDSVLLGIELFPAQVGGQIEEQIVPMLHPALVGTDVPEDLLFVVLPESLFGKTGYERLF